MYEVLIKTKGDRKLNNTKVAAAVLSGLFLTNIVGFSVSEYKVHTQAVEATELTQAEIDKAFADAVKENASSFENPEDAKIILSNLQAGPDEGKLTIAAKAGGIALKAAAKKIGQKAWDKIIIKVENTTGTKLVMLHYKSINQFLDFMVGFKGSVESGIKAYLVQYGVNATVAKYTAKTLVLVFL